MIRVGRCVYDRNGVKTDPSYPGFEPIMVVMKSHSCWYPLSPYYLIDNKGRIMENYWQFSKIYRTVAKTEQKKSRYDNKIVWSHPSETHIVTVDGKDIITDAYINWRNKGMMCPEPIRYPVGFFNRHRCSGAYAYKINPDGTESDEINTDELLNYIDSRKKIYVKKYCELVKKHPLFNELKQKLANGENLLIGDVDGPYQETLEHYIDTHGVQPNFLENNTVLINQESIRVLLNDSTHPFGHGYCLAMALLDKDIEWNV
jgi:hypothetical protein